MAMMVGVVAGGKFREEILGGELAELRQGSDLQGPASSVLEGTFA
jgi:hypothetical protein